MNIITERNPNLHRIIIDLHIHSKYSRATSQNMDIPTITHYARIKGLDLLGTGDFTHPLWLENLKNTLIEAPSTNLYRLKDNVQSEIYFMITTEVSTIFDFKGKVRKIHHVILTPSLEIAKQINSVLKKHGDLTIDGRPTFNISAPELVEKVMAVSKDNVVFPSHAWTPWFSLFGSINGFDNIVDCYQDMTKHIFALETGLSSDPPMNWRLGSLHKYCLLSNSDSHSPYPYRIGREANVFEVDKLTYDGIIKIIRTRDSKHFKFTIETNPAYGKYHWTGHKKCNISVSPKESREFGGKCPVCHKPLTRGVEERVEELADHIEGFRPKGAIGFLHMLPLQEIISAVLETDNPSTANVWKVYNRLVTKFGNEFRVLLDTPIEELEKTVEPRIALAILKVRRDEATVIPGYDGVYGKFKIFNKNEELIKDERREHEQTNLERFM